MTATSNESPGLVRFGVATRAMRRFSYSETVTNTAAASFRPVQLNATGWVRSIDLRFTGSMTCASNPAVVAGDAPFNLVSQITLNDATNKPIFTPITGYQLMLVNKYLPNGGIKIGNPRAQYDPTLGPDFAFATVSTTGATAVFNLSLDFEVDPVTHYGCIPNLDANAALTLQVNAAIHTVAYTGTTVSASTLQMDVYQNYWAPTGKTMGSQAVQDMPPGAGDYLLTQVQTATVSASTENLVPLVGMGGVQQGIIAVSRAAGVRTAITAASNVGLVYDNTDIEAGIPVEVFQRRLRMTMGLHGVDRTTAYTPVTGGLVTGLDSGVLAWPFEFATGPVTNRDQWFRTRVGGLQQLRLTPGASATQLEVITRTMQINDAAAFYN